MNRNLKSNEGFSMIEMLVSVLITAVMMLAVGVFISTSNVTFQKVTVSSKLQEESSAAMNFLSEVMIESVAMASYSDSDIKYWVFKSMDNEDGSGKLATGTTGIDYDYYIFMLTETPGENTKTLRYVKVQESDESLFAAPNVANSNNEINGLHEAMVAKYITRDDGLEDMASSKYNVVAQNIVSLDIAKKTSNVFSVTAKYKYISTEYDSNYCVNSRNKIQEYFSPLTTS